MTLLVNIIVQKHLKHSVQLRRKLRLYKAMKRTFKFVFRHKYLSFCCFLIIYSYMLIYITTFYNTNLEVKEKDHEDRTMKDHREEGKVIFKIIDGNSSFLKRSTTFVFSGKFSWDRSILPEAVICRCTLK